MSSNGAAEQNFELPEPDFDRFVPESGSDGGSSDGGEPQDKPSGALKSRKTHMAARQNQLAARYVDISFGLQIQYYFFCLFLGIIPFFAYGSAFTQIGWGLQLLGYLKSQASLSPFLLGGGVSILLLLYLFDFSYWKGRWNTFKNIVLVIILSLIIGGLWTRANTSPELPLFLFYIFVPIYYAVCKSVFFKGVHESHYMSAVAGAYLTAGLICLLVWIVWGLEYAQGDMAKARVKLNGRLFCTPYIRYDEADKEYLYCTSPAPVGEIGSQINPSRYNPINSTHDFAPEFCNEWSLLRPADVKCQLGSFMIFYGMLGTAFVAVFFAGICQTLSYILAGVQKKSKKLLKVFGFLLAISMMGVYLGSALTMANSGVSDLVVSFSIFGIVATVNFLASSLGWQSLEKDLSQNEGVKALAEWDSVKGLAVLFFAVPYAFFYLISCLNQFIRKTVPCAYDFAIDGDGKLMEAEEEKKLRTTLIFHNQWKLIKNWHLAYVLTWSMVWGFLLFSVNILITKFVYVILSMLSDWMQSSLPFLGIIGVFYLVGLLMFLNPAIPGVPVYLVGGVVVTRVGESVIGFWQSSILVCLVCFVLKLNAVVVQQKIFGEKMAGSRVWIRALIGINSPTTRAIKKILVVPGLNLAKVVILCGGPDWPTSVTTGILRCNLWQMLLGTVPILVLIVPTVMTGAFKNKENESSLYRTLSSLFMSGTTVVQSGAMMLAMYYINKTRAEHYEELSKPDETFDEAVDKLDKLNALKSIKRKELTQWNNLSTAMRANLLCGTIISMLYTFLFFGASATGIPGLSDPCFKDFNLSDSVSVVLDGNPLNIIMRNGYIGLGMFFVALVNYKIYNRHADNLVSLAVKDDETFNNKI
jgi:hypothetical protein